MKSNFVIAVLAVAVCLASSSIAVADIYNWQTGQVIPGTEGITPGPGMNLSYWNTPSHNLQYADFHGPNWTNLRYSAFNWSWLDGANFSLAYLDSANFTGANLTGADFVNSVLTNANLTDAVVAGVRFSKTNITSAQLYATASYKNKNLTGIGLAAIDLTNWNFAGQNLTGAYFGAIYGSSTLTGADLTDAIVAGTNFEGCNITVAQLYSTASYKAKDLAGITLGASPPLPGSDLTGCNLAGQNLTGAGLRGTTLSGADLTNADVSGADLGCTDITKEQFYSTANYKAKNLAGIGLDYDNLTGWNFAGQNLTGAGFFGATLTGANLSNANLAGASFQGGVLSGANLTGAAVAGASFVACNITSAQLYSTASYEAKNLSGITLANNDLTGWNFSGQNLTGAQLWYANLTGADFSNANLTGAYLVGATFTGANFTGANLTGLNFYKTTLSGADFSDADMRGAFSGGYSVNLTGAIVHNTILPNGEIQGLALGSGDETLLVRNSPITAWVGQDWMYGGGLVVSGALNMASHTMTVSSGGAFTLSSGSASFNALNVQNSATANYNGGTLTANSINDTGTLNVGNDWTYGGNLVVSGALNMASKTMTLSSGGVFTLSDGSASVNALNVQSGATANYNGGTLTASAINVGGTFSIGTDWTYGGSLAVSGALNMASNTMTVSSGGAFTLSSGSASLAALNVAGTANYNGGTLAVPAITAGGTFNVNLDWTYGGNLAVYGNVNMSAHTLTVSNGGTLAMGTDFNTSTLFGASAVNLSAATLEVMNIATATQNGAGTFDVTNLRIGSGNGAGTYNLSNGNLSATNSLRIGADGGNGTFNWTAGDLAAPSIIVGAQGTFNSNNNWTYGGNLSVSGALNMASNTMTVSNGGVFTLSNGSASFASLNIVGTGNYNGGALITPVITLSGTFNYNLSSDWAYGGNLAVTGNLNMASHTMTLINGGMFALSNGTASFSTLNVDNGATVDYTGGALSAPTITSSGTFNVGQDWTYNGNLAVSGALNMASNTMTVSSGGLFTLGNGSASFSALNVNNGATVNYAGGTLAANTINVSGTLNSSNDWTYGGNLVVYGNINMSGHALTINGGTFAVGRNFDVGGFTFNASGLNLANATLEVMNGATAAQDIATFDVGNLYIGSSKGAGAYNVNAGGLTTGNLYVASNGTFNINTATIITIGNNFTLDDGAVFIAAPDTTIHMTGSNFYNYSTDEAALAGLANIEMIFEGGPAEFDVFEIAGWDFGADVVGFNGNFALGQLTLGGGDVAHLTLIDDFNNGNRGGIGGYAEALYVNSLIINNGCTLDLNGYHLYTLNYANLGGTVLNGDVIVLQQGPAVIPEPGTLALIAPALLGFVGIAFKRMRCR